MLILSRGYGQEHLQKIATDTCKKLGFDAHVYSRAGYPADRTVFSHAACVKAIEQHDIVVAIIDSGEGGTFQVEKVPKPMVRELRQRHILPPAKRGALVPTILEVEVMSARGRGLPTLILMPKTVENEVHETIEKIQSGVLKLTPRRPRAASPKALIASSDWDRLAQNYELARRQRPTLRQLAFIERLRKRTPNWVSFFEESDSADLRAQIRSSLADVMQQVVPCARGFVGKRLRTTRPLTTSTSLQDILDAGLIVQPPFSVDSIKASPSEELVQFDSMKHGLLAESLLNSKSILLVGPPGVGKTTISLLALKDLLSERALDSHSLAPLYCQGRELTAAPRKSDDLYRLLLGVMNDRFPWPAKVPLPNGKWLLVLDGIDESPLDPNQLDDMLGDLPAPTTLLLTCRDVDFELRLAMLGQHVEKIIHLDLWKDTQVHRYVERLRKTGKDRAADFIAERLSVASLRSDVISIPLWLSMLSYLADQPTARGRPEIARALRSEYSLLKTCWDAICEGEITRHALASSKADALKADLARTAFELHVAKRQGKRIPLQQLAKVLQRPQGSALFRAVCSVLEIAQAEVVGFTHEVFREFWLAQYLVGRLSDVTVDAGEIARLFSYQRSVVTNRLLRARIVAEEDSTKLGKRLRDVYFDASFDQERKDFAQNQLVYLAGRIDNSPGTYSFLRLLWGNSKVPEVIRHSAAFAAIIRGDMEIEREYYDLLRHRPKDDQINRGYHLYYYEDQDVPENKMPPIDDESATARYTLQHLFERLGRSEQSNLNLRRIELFTIRRFLETGRSLPIPKREALSIVRRVGREIRAAREARGFADSVRSEVSQLVRLISQSRRIGRVDRKSSNRRQ